MFGKIRFVLFSLSLYLGQHEILKQVRATISKSSQTPVCNPLGATKKKKKKKKRKGEGYKKKKKKRGACAFILFTAVGS